MLTYGKQTIEEDDIEAVADVLRSDFLTTGPKVAEFENALADSTGASEAVVVGNGTQALHLACLAIGLGPGDLAIVPTITFLATANAARYCGADILFCDVDPVTGLLDLHALEILLQTHKNQSVKAIFPVHLGGQIVDLSAIKSMVEGKDIAIIADSCHAIGGQKGAYKVGSATIEDMSTFSFHPVKTIAMGEGGAITLNDKKVADHMRLLRSHHMKKTPDIGAWAYEMDTLGYNYRATDFQCALGLSQLKKLERFKARRKAFVSMYNDRLKSCAPLIKTPEQPEGQDVSWHLYAARFDFKAIGKGRDQIMAELQARGIGTQVHYIPVHTQPYYQNLYGKVHLPGADHYYERTLALPLYPLMNDEDIEHVVSSIKEIIQ